MFNLTDLSPLFVRNDDVFWGSNLDQTCRRCSVKRDLIYGIEIQEVISSDLTLDVDAISIKFLGLADDSIP